MVRLSAGVALSLLLKAEMDGYSADWWDMSFIRHLAAVAHVGQLLWTIPRCVEGRKERMRVPFLEQCACRLPHSPYWLEGGARMAKEGRYEGECSFRRQRAYSLPHATDPRLPIHLNHHLSLGPILLCLSWRHLIHARYTSTHHQ